MGAKEKTMERVREEFLNHVRDMIQYWQAQEQESVESRIDGVAFSILAALDGCAASLPSFIVAPLPHKDDKECSIIEGTDFYPENHEAGVRCDIAGSLHNLLYRRRV